MFWKRKLRVQAEELAFTLFEEFVQTPIYGMSEELQIDTNINSSSGRKLQLYQFASLLLAVLNAERRDKTFLPVRESLERLFYASSFAGGEERTENLQRAMSELIELFQPDGKSPQMQWAHYWLDSVGMEEDNPATLAMFIYRWPHHFAAATKALREFQPIA